MSKSIYNNSTTPLDSNEVFRGLFEECNQDFVEINVDLKTDTNSLLVIEQSNDKTNVIKRNIYDYVAGSIEPYITTITTTYFRVIVRNTSNVNQQYLSLTSYIEAIVNGNVLQVLNTEGLQTKLLSNLEGHLIVDTSSTSGTTSNVNIKSFETSLPVGENTIGSVVVSSIYSNIIIAGVANQDGQTYDISVETELRPTPEPPNQIIHKLETYDYTAIQSLESINTKLTTGILTHGQNTDFAFYPDATNLTSAIYADGQLPYLTTPAGWVYSNDGNAPNKINWYVFQDATLPQYLVSEMNSIYFVISQLIGATTLPFVGFYTMPNGINDIVPEFAKSRLVFAPNGEVPTTQGEYLFYVKSDPTHIRPEITNRYELTFSVANSSKTLEQASGERLSLATLSTNSTDPTNSNYFLFQQYGIVWAKTPVSIPINNGKVECNVTLQPVTLAPSTADIGYVILKAENLLSNPSTFANLQIQGADLQVVDQQAVTFLSSIDDNSSSIRTNTDVLNIYTQNIDTNIGIIKNSNNGIETLTDSINGKITACDTGAVVLTTGTADIGSVSIQGDDSGVSRKLSALNNGGLYALQTNDITGNFYLDTINTFLTNNLSRLAITGNYAENVINTYTNLTLTPAFMYNLNVYSNGSSGTNFLKVYGLTNATIANTPLLIIPIDHATSVNLTLSGLKGISGVSVRATQNYSPSDNTAPSNSISCNLTYSATS